MKTNFTPMILIGSVALMNITAYPAMGQEALAETTTIAFAECPDRPAGTTSTSTVSSIDFVNAQFNAVSYNGDAFVRTTTQACAGSFAVRVVDANGTVRLTGAYADAALGTPHGLFTYFHENGAIESHGTYLNGTKAGTWERYAKDGTRLSDREYPGLSVDSLLELNGLVAYARTLK